MYCVQCCVRQQLPVLLWVMKGNSAIQCGHTASCTQRARYLNCATFSNDLLASEGSGYLSSQNSD